MKKEDSFRFCFLCQSSLFWYFYLPLSKDDALENKSSKNWNFGKNLVENVHLE